MISQKIFLSFAFLCFVFTSYFPFVIAAPDTTENTSSGDQAKQEQKLGQGLSNAEQVLKIEANIKADQERIEELEKELEKKQISFTKVSEGLKKLGQQKMEKEQQLSELANQKSKAAQDLQQEIESLSKEYELFNNQANLNLKAQKTLQEQIKGLEKKIINDQNLLDGLRGKTSLDTTTQPGITQTTPAPATDTTLPIRTPVPIPSAPAQTEAPQQEEIEALATPEQIEAQKEEQEKRAEAKQAEQIVVDYVERKKALENQISREQQLLNNETESRSNIENYLKTLEEKQATANQEGNQKEANKLRQEILEMRKELRRLQKEIVSRSVLLNQLHQQLTEVHEAQLQAVEMAEEKRQAAETARQKNVWLQSPLHPHNIAQWGMTRGPRVLLVIAFMVLLLFISKT